MINIVPKKVEKLGAVYDENGVNFSIFSENADYVELCLFDGRSETRAILPSRSDDGVWSGYVKNLEPGTRYGYRVYGPYEPENGKRFNPNKLLLDPYAKELDAEFSWNNNLLAYDVNQGVESFSLIDNADFIPKSVVVDENKILNYPRANNPQIPWHQSIIYETHLKGFTKLNDEIHELKRGTFAGLSEKKVIQYIKSLGVNCIELLPVFACSVDRYLGAENLTNYWGYDTVAFFACRYSYGRILEFKKMINALHDAGIEVILDVVYNHTGDGDETGPTLTFKGIDNQYYYHLQENDKAKYKNFSGCGNALNFNKPYVKKLVKDSLSYWSKIGVDGFRFDLASVMARDENGLYSSDSQFFQMMKETPQFQSLKLIAEPWDTCGDGFQLGNYPSNFKQWNSTYRDTMKNLTSSRSVKRGDIAYCLSGCDNLGNNEGRSLSLNYIASHDGFTLADFFTYTHKRNQQNPWNNNDGPNEIGCELDNQDKLSNRQLVKERFLRIKNNFALLMMSIGVPMFVAGAEKARSQKGNNNPYCQDNRISWLKWRFNIEQKNLFKFVAKLIKIRKKFSNILGDTLLTENDVLWLNNNAEKLTENDWNDNISSSLNYVLKDKFFVIINLNESESSIKFPKGKWKLFFSTNPKKDFKSMIMPIKLPAHKKQKQFYKTSRQEVAVFIKA